MNFDSIFFRVDANREVGLGHAKRCYVIAREILKSFNGKIYFITEDLPIDFQKKIKSLGIEIIFNNKKYQTELEFITYAVANKGETELIIDSYNSVFYWENFQKELLKNVTKLTYIVFESTNYHYYAHLLHNQNPLSLSSNYSTEPYTKRLFGLQNLILDEKIRQLAKYNTRNYNKTETPVALLTFGGSDPNDLTLKILKSLSLINNKFKEYIVVIGGMNPHEKSLIDFISSSSMDIELYKNANNMHELMLNCDIAFVSGGITTWELGALGVPVIILPAGKREYTSAKFLHESGWAQLIEQPLKLSSSDLAKKIDSLMVNDIGKMSEHLKNELNVDGVENFVRSLFE